MTKELPSLHSAPPWKPREWTLAEYLALPEAAEDTGGCPLCGGRHWGSINVSQRGAPGVYRCHGTEHPNSDGAPYQPPCSGLFRGRPGVHFDADYFAPFFMELHEEGEPEMLTVPDEPLSKELIEALAEDGIAMPNWKPVIQRGE